MKKSHFIACVLASIIPLSYAQNVDTSFAGKKEMNGYSMDTYGEFWNNWKLVTVRYRKDTNEIRLTYANDIAWNSLQKKNFNFPDGSVFGKVAFQASPDKLFESSLIPNVVHRYQLMVKDNEKYKENRGWEYAIFDSTGRTLPENPKSIVKACVACHEYAAPRGYVFLGGLDASIQKFDKISTAKLSPEDVAIAAKSTVKFEDVKPSDMPGEMSELLMRADASKVKSIAGPLKEHLFSGTLNEIRPTLIKQAITENAPAVLVSLDRSRWVAVYKTGYRDACSSGQYQMAVSMKSNPAKPISTDKWCETGDGAQK